MNNKDLSQFSKTSIIVSIVFFVIFTISVGLYYRTSYIEEIVQLLLIFPIVSLFFLHDHWHYPIMYWISLMMSILVVIFGTTTIILLDLPNKNLLFISAVIPLIFISLYRILNDFFQKIFKRNPYFLDRKKYEIEDYLYNFFLIASTIGISFIVYDSLKEVLFN